MVLYPKPYQRLIAMHTTMYVPNAISRTGSQSFLAVKTCACRHLVLPVTPYFGVRTNSADLPRIPHQIASNTALVLFNPTPTPSDMRAGRYNMVFHPACLPS